MSVHRPCALLLALWALAPAWTHAEGLLAVNNPALNGIERQIYAEAEAFAGNDALAVSEYVGQWQGDYAPRDGENIGLASARAEFGAQWQGFRLGALYRAEALVRSNRDTTDLARQSLTNGLFDSARTYQLDYQLRGFEADGLRLSKSLVQDMPAGWSLRWGVAAALLQGKRLKLVTASGQALTLNGQDVTAQVNQTTRDSHMGMSGAGGFTFNPPGGARPEVSGLGWALDLGLVMQHPTGLQFEAAVNDLYGVMAWTNLPDLRASYTTAKQAAQGDYTAPQGNSVSSYQNITQTLDPKVWLAMSYPAGPVALYLGSSFVSGLYFPEVGASYPLPASWRVKASYDTRFGSAGVMLSARWFYAGWRTQSLKLDAAKAYGLSTGVRLEF